ncbi:MAG: GAF domain-containing sensor histidine kinase [Anaerolineales bacterium]|nr:GAF domain-containing sensor histidine kinase [Anaerolineales bacterium]
MRTVRLPAMTEQASPSAPAARSLAWSLAVASIGLAVAALGLALRGALTSGDFRTLLSHQSVTPLLTLGFAILGALVAARHPRNPIGWMFVATGLLFALTALAAAIIAYGPSASPLRPWVVWFGSWLWLPAVIMPVTLVLLLFPDGRLPSPRWAFAGWAAVLGVVLALLMVMLHPGPLSSWQLPANPFGLPGSARLLEAVGNVGLVCLLIAFVGALAAVWVRFRRSTGILRQQLKWLVYAVVLNVVANVAGSVVAAVWPGLPWTVEIMITLTNLGILAIVAAAAIAILRYRLYDIDLVINRTLVYGALTLAVAALYLLVVGGLGVLLQARGSLWLSLAGVGLVAFVAQPVRERVQRGVNRLMYGERDEPYAVLSRLGQRLEATLLPEAVLPTLVETVAQALKLPYAAVLLKTDDGFTRMAEHGRPGGEPLRLPLAHHGEAVGQLLVSPRAPGESFSPDDQQLLDDLARQAGVALYAVGLTLSLQRSRERLVSAREEERRRLRRDLHDGLGSQLSALHLQAGTLRLALPPGLPAVEAGLSELQVEIHAAIGDLRRLVYALRPPALDELGLAGALRSLAAQCSTTDGLRVQVSAAEQLPPLPAAVEAAAYRITQEALANIVRHAHAHAGQVRLSVNGGLRLEIQDDGVGLPAERTAGVGLRSMRERAEELGGACAVEAVPGGGTCVVVYLPLPAAPE